MQTHVIVSGGLDTDWFALVLQIAIPSFVAILAAALTVLLAGWYQKHERRVTLHRALTAEVLWIQGKLTDLLARHSHAVEVPGSEIEFLTGASLLFKNSASDLGILRADEMLTLIKFHAELSAVIGRGLSKGVIKKSELEAIPELGKSIVGKQP